MQTTFYTRKPQGPPFQWPWVTQHKHLCTTVKCVILVKSYILSESARWIHYLKNNIQLCTCDDVNTGLCISAATILSEAKHKTNIHQYHRSESVFIIWLLWPFIPQYCHYTTRCISKGRDEHYCDVMVAPLWCNLEHHSHAGKHWTRTLVNIAFHRWILILFHVMWPGINQST